MSRQNDDSTWKAEINFALQTGRKNVTKCVFDDCSLSKSIFKVESIFKFRILSVQRFKSGFCQKEISCSDMYARFHKAYYGINCFKTLLNISRLSRKGFLRSLIACDKMNLSRAPLWCDVRIEFDCKENVPANITAYYLIIHRVIFDQVVSVVQRSAQDYINYKVSIYLEL